jgi:hypothetical protein
VTLTAFSACGGEIEAAGWCLAPESAPGVAVAWNDGADRALRLTELWRVGGLAEGQELSLPTHPAVRADGAVALPDIRLGEVVVVAAGGAWIGSIAPKGDGPGELRQPGAAGWTGDGDLLAFDAGSAKIVRFDGNAFGFVEETRLSPEASAHFARGRSLAFAMGPDGSILFDAGWQATQPGAPVELPVAVVRLPPGGNSPDTLITVRTTLVPGSRPPWVIPGAGRAVFAASAAGGVAVGGEGATYRIRILSRALSDSLVICRDAEPLPLALSEVGDTAVGPQYQAMARGLAESRRADSLAPFGRIFFGVNGRLWVQRDRLNPLHFPRHTLGATYDVFEAGGAYAGTVAAPTGVTFFGESTEGVVGLEVGQFDETYVVAYRITE